MRKVKKAQVEEGANLRKNITSLPEENMFSFVWTVFNGYEIVDRWEEDENEPGKPVTVRYVAAKDPVFGQIKMIKPLEEFPTLYNKFSKIEIDSEDSILDFVRAFGLLTDEREERLDTFLTSVSAVRDCLTLYAGINSGSLKEEDYYGTNLDELLLERIFNSDEKKSIGSQALDAIIRHINKNIRGCYPLLTVKNNSMMPLNACENLLGAIYLQIYEKISDRGEMVQCEECSSWFFPTRKGQKYCPPLFGEKKSACLNRKLVRENRKRIKK